MARNETKNRTNFNSHLIRGTSVVGQPLVKVDALEKVTGQQKFADDLALPRMLYGKILGSTMTHAKILSIDTSRAEALPGVHAVITGEALPVKFGILPVSQDETALAQDRVRYVGDPVAAVAAIDEETAEKAIELIDVEYEPLPTFMSIEESLADSEVQIHEYAAQGNIHKFISLEFGDMEEGLAEADYIREDVIFYQGTTHLPMEQHAALAQAHPDGKLTLWSSTQVPHYVHRALARVLEMPPSRIRVIATPPGGGFGGKTDPFAHEIIACKLSQITGRPVKIALTREEVFYAHRGRHPVLMWLKTGVKQTGEITAHHLRTCLDGGAYGSYGVAASYYTGALQTVTYKMPRYKFEGARVFTNKAPCGPKRGHATPQPRFALEIHIDKICHDMGWDPLEWRLSNLCEPYSQTANKLRITTIGLGECLGKVAEASGFREGYGALPRGRGLGIAGSSYLSGANLPIYWNKMPHSGVQLKVDRGGGVTVFCGSTDIGQGSTSVLAYIVAEELGLSPADIAVVTADTDLTPVDLGSYSSRVTLMTGNAAIDAARKVGAQIAEVVAEELGATPDAVEFADGRVVLRDDPGVGLPFDKSAQLAEARFGTLGAVGSYTPPSTPGRYKGSGVGPTPAYSYSAAVVEVEVDEETGWIHIPKVWLAHDIGRAINPVLVEGQIVGSVYMGLGEALMEEQKYRLGLHEIPSMLDYKSPTFLEMPEVESFLVETFDPNGPYGAKEVGQGPLLPVAPALANAIFDALGVRIDETPITPDKILKALEAGRKGKEPRYGPASFPDIPYPEPIREEPPSLETDPEMAPAHAAGMVLERA
ncbi:MAG: molybdopterin cofactor-binding domain-containing protein [Anaerolineae bacterium]